MKILFILVILAYVMAGSKKHKQPNLITVNNKEYHKTHQHVSYNVDSFTSPRTQRMKNAQHIQDNSLKKAIQHSQQFVQLSQQEDLSSELMTEQQLQQALLTSEDYNNIPNIEMQSESNYEKPADDNQDVNEAYYIPIVSEGDGTLEEVDNTEDISVEQIEQADIEMPAQTFLS